MKKLLSSLFIFPLLLSCGLKSGGVDYTEYVDPYIGSGGHGHVFVGASVPFGAVQVGPSNIHKGWDWCSQYHYSDSLLIGFAHQHLNGTGCTDLGEILIMPRQGKVTVYRGEQNDTIGAYSTTYSHKNEFVSPYKYSLLLNSGIKAELTASARVGFHRYTFNDSNETPYLVVDLKEGNGDRSYETYIEKVDEYTIKGYRFSKGWSPDQKVFFVLKTDKPVAETLLFDDLEYKDSTNYLKSEGVKGVLKFDDNVKSLQVKVALSSVSCENALLNLNTEIPHWNFEEIVSKSKSLWNKELSKINIETSDSIDRTIFYTSLYHTFVAPTLHCDVNNEFRGVDGNVYKSNHTNYTRFSLWDTYRAAQPLLTITQPNLINDMVNSMLDIYDQQGKLPIWPLYDGETNQMPGYSAVPVVVDAYLKGFDGFDANRAYEACKASSVFRKQEGISDLLDYGMIPCDSIHAATSIAMEYAMGDNAIAMMAKKLGKEDDYELYSKRALYFEKYFDKSIGFIRPRMKDGSWRTPYNPIESIHIGDFCEGNGWQYTFFVPHNPERLIELMGGDDRFNDKLDEFFATTGDLGEHASIDITGLIGMYAHGNEPSHHICYLYSYSGQPWKTAEKVNYIINEFYSANPDGLIGNEDCGQMSAWYILSAIGFYPVNPSNGCYVFGTPHFEKVTIDLPQNKKFTVKAESLTDSNIYIQSVLLNGKEYNKSYIHYSDIMSGGELCFIMGSKPNKTWGTELIDRPTSKY